MSDKTDQLSDLDFMFKLLGSLSESKSVVLELEAAVHLPGCLSLLPFTPKVLTPEPGARSAIKRLTISVHHPNSGSFAPTLLWRAVLAKATMLEI